MQPTNPLHEATRRDDCPDWCTYDHSADVHGERFHTSDFDDMTPWGPVEPWMTPRVQRVQFDGKTQYVFELNVTAQIDAAQFDRLARMLTCVASDVRDYGQLTAAQAHAVSHVERRAGDA